MDRTDFFWDDFAWTTLVPMPPDASPQGPAGASNKARVPLHYAPEGREDHPLENSEIASVTWTIDNLSLLLSALQPKLVSYYQDFRTNPDLESEDLPVAENAADLSALVNIEALYVHQVTKDRIPYVGIEFTCSWDEEHGLGALIHGTRAVDIGGADTAVLLWIAEEDAEQPHHLDNQH